MRKIREVLRLCFDHQLGQREIARSAVVSQSTVNEYLARFAASGLTWPLPAGMSETSLEARLYPPKLPKAPVAPAPPPPATETQPEPTTVAARCPTSPDWQQVDQEMQSHITESSRKPPLAAEKGYDTSPRAGCCKDAMPQSSRGWRA